jgi:ribose transport system ATP-binding protein
VHEPLIEVRDLELAYGSQLAVRDADFDLFPGEIVGLLGKNGAGKSSLIKVLSGGAHARRGVIRLQGTDIDLARHSPGRARQLGLAVMHQELETYPGMTVADNVAVGTGLPHNRIGLVHRSELRRRVRRTLHELGATIHPAAPIESLSPAAQRTVMIARALYRQARVLVLDEPTTSLTAREIDGLHQMLRKLAASGHGIVYVSHRLDEVAAITSRVVVMRDGEVITNRSSAGLAVQELIEAISGHQRATTGSERRASRRDRARIVGPVRLSVESLSAGRRVHDVSFEAHAGEILGIAGLVGSGRTELLRSVFGADRRDISGTVRIDGAPARIRSPRDAIAAGVALLPEDRRHEGLVDTFGIRENVTLAALAGFRRLRLPIPHRERERQRTAELIRELRVHATGVDQPVAALSGGNQQKVVIAKWMLRNGRILMFDEPTQGIDVDAKEEVYQLMERLARDGAAVVLVSSEFGELVAVCDRVVVLREGRLMTTLTEDEVSEHAITRACFAEALPTKDHDAGIAIQAAAAEAKGSHV